MGSCGHVILIKHRAHNFAASFQINSLEGVIQVKLLCRKGIFSQKKKVGSIYLCLERIPFENYENGELVAWYKLLRKR